MKKLILSASILFLGLTLTTKAQESVTSSLDPNAPVMKFETEVLDYGTIEYGSNGEREFKFSNTGKSPLIISQTQGSCGCTVPSHPKEPIMPGKTGVIKVKYDTKRPGNFEKNVTVTSNADTPTKVIKIKGTVKAAPASENK